VILAAGLLVLAGLGLFVAGILTGVTVLYWGCVAACVVAAVLLIAARRQMNRQPSAGAADETRTAPATKTAPATTTAPAASTEKAEAEAPTTAAPAGATAVGSGSATGSPTEEPPAGRAEDRPDPEVEEVEVTDLLIIVDLKDEVLVVDEHPRYHVAECSWLAGRETIPLPLDEARTDGFTPCAVCSPDRTLAERARAKKHAGS
jgi:hypothetical protein